MHLSALHTRGFTLIEVIIVAAVLVLFFGGIMLAIQYSTQLITSSRVRVSALSVATDRLEFARALPYHTIGTIAGFPAGPIPAVETVVFNDFTFTVRTLIDFVDDPADGSAGADGNLITTDYKQIEVIVEWTLRGVTDQVTLKGSATPLAIETNVGGGTIRANVFDATVAPVPNATVRVFNESGILYDQTRFTDSSGSALFSVASGSNYQIEVSRTGFSRDGTLVATTSVPNPATSPITVLEAGISTMNFFIDRTSTLTVALSDSVTRQTLIRDLTDSANWATTTAIAVSSGTVTLADTAAGVYVPTGSLMLTAVAPASLAHWEYIVLDAAVPTDTTVRYRFYTSTSTADVIPDSVLPGNSAGFTNRVVNLRALDATTYPAIVLGFELTTSDTAKTPELDQVTIVYAETVSLAATQAFTLVGQKTIGTNASSIPVPKTRLATSTDGVGQRTFSALEWDTYQLELPAGVAIRESCPALPFSLIPNTTATITAQIGVIGGHSLLVTVTDSAGEVLPATAVVLQHSGSTIATATTTGCGQVYFPGLPSQLDYRLELTHPDAGTVVVDPVPVADASSVMVTY
jgi:prepilin-type N-terminal cleavage/methylation domain-containing protein